MTRTTVGQSAHQYVAMGITSDGEAYGVATDGNFYHIDRSNGKETLKALQEYKQHATTETLISRVERQIRVPMSSIGASVDSTGLSMLYTVDLADGHVTQVSPMGNTNVMALTIPAPKAADGAPDKVKKPLLRVCWRIANR